MKRLVTLLIAGLAFIALGCAMETQAADDIGSISVDLTIAAGFEIGEVDWELTNGMFTESGVIDISAPGSTASIEVFGVPAGPGYVMEMQAVSTNGAASCLGSAPLNVNVGEVSEVDVLLNCELPETLGAIRANGRFNVCANLAQVVVSPLQTSVGNEIELESVAVDEDGDLIEYSWTATGGSVGDPSASATTYVCEVVGEHSITISVSDDGFDQCGDAWTTVVTCNDGA
jgi:hypothetical protein